MPRVALGQNLTLSDHWIRIHKERESSGMAPTETPGNKPPDPDEHNDDDSR
jgi:hypothetical protein